MTDKQILSTSPMKQSVSMTSLPPPTSNGRGGDNDASDSSIAAKVLIDRPYNSLKVRNNLLFESFYAKCKSVRMFERGWNKKLFNLCQIFALLVLAFRNNCIFAFSFHFPSSFAVHFELPDSIQLVQFVCCQQKTPFTFSLPFLYSEHANCFKMDLNNEWKTAHRRTIYNIPLAKNRSFACIDKIFVCLVAQMHCN